MAKLILTSEVYSVDIVYMRYNVNHTNYKNKLTHFGIV